MKHVKRRTQHQGRCGHGLGRGVGCKHYASMHRYRDTQGHGDMRAGCTVKNCDCRRYMDPLGDVLIEQVSPGFFQVNARNAEARRWLEENVHVESYQGTHAAFSVDDARVAHEIIDGLKNDGLIVRTKG